MIQKSKSLSFCFLMTFLFSVIFFEVFANISGAHSGDGYWIKRQMRENTAIEMHAEDIWQHGRSTLKAFDPLSCKIAPHHDWLGYWSEVSCVSEDENGRRWQYKAKYSTSHTTLFFIPMLINVEPIREMTEIGSAK